MSKILIAYYSLEGNVDFVARNLAKEIGADLFRIETVKEYPKKGLAKFFHGGKDAVTNACPELKTPLPDLTPYDLIVIGTPVWASRPASPINTILKSADFTGKKIAAFASSAGGNTGKTFDAISTGLKNKGRLFATASFKNPLRSNEAATEEIKRFAEEIKKSNTLVQFEN